MYIGKRVKELREIQGMKLVELAEKSGVQIATLSRIENLKMTGTLESHMHIAKALGVDVTQLYTDIVKEEDKVDLKTKRSVSDVFVHSDKSSYEILISKVLSKKMMPILLKIEPQGKTNKEQNPIGSEKFIFVLDGKIEVKIGKEAYSLSKHNTLYFDASLEHSFINSGKSTAKVICVVTPVAL
jgi:transcriptional regulator with XRE-family HTH domain